jgi:cell division protein FtsI (penicillin-binding protein 3)
MRAVTDGFEPGSIFKVVVAAAALESNRVGPQETFFCENGSYPIGNQIIHDTKPHGLLSFEGFMKVSSNIGAAKIAERVGRQRFEEMLGKLGFGQKTGIDFPGEDNGFFRRASSWTPIDFANIAFGQGIRVTPLQMIRAYAIVASGGMDLQPHLASKITDPRGETVWSLEKTSKRVLSEKTAKTITKMLGKVTEEGGTGSLARIPGYSVAGKTGTAQKVTTRGYSQRDFISSFVGFAPAYSPKFVILIKLDRPQGIKFAADSLSPTFGDITRFLLRYFNLPPTRG